MLEIVVKVIGSFSSYRADLLIASGITWNEEDGNATQLERQSIGILDAGVTGEQLKGRANLCVLVDALFPIHVQRVLGRKASVFRVKLGE
jgi:hypothetical protein